MSVTSDWRGHRIRMADSGEWVFVDSGEVVAEDLGRSCGHCGQENTPEGHDPCLGTLPENVVMNACCGHGGACEPYIQFWTGISVRGEPAEQLIAELKLDREGA